MAFGGVAQLGERLVRVQEAVRADLTTLTVYLFPSRLTAQTVAVLTRKTRFDSGDGNLTSCGGLRDRQDS